MISGTAKAETADVAINEMWQTTIFGEISFLLNI